MTSSNPSSRKLGWKLLLLQGLGAGLVAFLGSWVLQSAWGAALGGALGALIAVPIGRVLMRPR